MEPNRLDQVPAFGKSVRQVAPQTVIDRENQLPIEIRNKNVLRNKNALSIALRRQGKTEAQVKEMLINLGLN